MIIALQLLKKRYHSLINNEKGVSAVEFALVAPILFAVLFVAIEVIVILFADATLEATANKVTRIGKLGVPENQTCESTVKNIVTDSLAGWAKEGSIFLDVKKYTPGANNELPEIEDGYEPICDAGERGDIVMYRISITRPGLTGFLHWMGLDIIRLERFVIIQNEP